MRFRHPIYYPFVFVLLLYVGFANHNGWSLMQSVAARTWQRVGPATLHK